ncbi:MAG: VanW family protein [Intestinibacter sp.]|uniref:VanW family protein n=1 Tax=Intestinibacter sp. TaxID=1965304 RepID=UPI003F15D860
MKKRILLGILCVILVLAGVGAYSISGDKISKNVYVKDINIGNLTKQEAKKKLSSEYKMETFNFKYGDGKWSVNPKEISVTYDIDETIDKAYSVNRDSNIVVNIFNSLKSMAGYKTNINVSINCDEDKLEQKLKDISKDINVDVKNATLEVKNDEVEVVKEEKGLELDIKSSKKNFIKNLQNGDFIEELVVKTIEPEVKSSDLDKVDTLLGSYTTVLSDVSYGRVQNIKLACEKTTDVLLMPGEEYSYNKHTGARSLKNGYQNAHVISGGEVTNGVGGGICQVSSTMFNSVLYAGLDIVSRTNHSIPSDYVALGRDATVTDTGVDFVFKNNYKNPVFIKNYYSNGVVKSQIFGAKSDNKKIEISTVINSVISYSTTQQQDSTLSEGVTKTLERGRTGYTVSTYRIYYDENGKQTKKENVCSSYYPSKNAVVAVGTKKAAVNQSPAINQVPNNNNNNKNPGNTNNNSGDNNQGGETVTPDPGTSTGDTTGGNADESN